MILDKTLVLKGVAGVAALGGVVGGGFAVQGAGLFSSSSKPAAAANQENATDNQQSTLQSSNDQATTDGDRALKPEGVGGSTVDGSHSPSSTEKTEEQKKTEKKESVNQELTKLGLTDCLLEDSNLTDSTTFSKECELDQAKFKKIKFSNSGETDVDVQGWNGENKVMLAISNKTDGKIKFLFKDVKDDLTITKSTEDQTNKITIKKERETEFEDKDGKLSKVVDQALKAKLEGINNKLGTLGLSDTTCRFDVTEKDETLECELDEAKFKAINFSNKGSTDVTVTGWGSGNIKLKIAESNSKVSYTFKNITSKLTISGDATKPDIVLKANVDREFEENEGKLSKVSLNSQEETAKITALNEKLKTLKIPDKCRFDETEKDGNSIECDLSNKEAELKKIKFANKEDGAESKIDGSTSGLKLTINRLSDDDASKKHSPKTDLEFIFGGYSSEIKIQDIRSSGGYADIVLTPNTNPILTISTDSSSQGKLFKTFGINNFSSKLGLSCTSSVTACTPSGSDKKIKIFKDKTDEMEEITISKDQENTQIMNVADNTSGYEQGLKYTGKTSFPSTGTGTKIQANVEYQAKYVKGKGWGLVKKN